MILFVFVENFSCPVKKFYRNISRICLIFRIIVNTNYIFFSTLRNTGWNG